MVLCIALADKVSGYIEVFYVGPRSAITTGGTGRYVAVEWLNPPTMSGVGTSETCQHVRFLVAIRGKADIEKAALNKGVS